MFFTPTQTWQIVSLPSCPTMPKDAIARAAVASSAAHGAATAPALADACGSASDHPPPEHYQVGLVIATCGLLITLGMHRRANHALRARTAFSSKRVLYRLITGLAPAIAWVHFLGVTSPPMHRVAALAHHCLVAFVMACFMELMLLLLFRTARAGEGGVDESAVPAIPNVLQVPYSAHATRMPRARHAHAMRTTA